MLKNVLKMIFKSWKKIDFFFKKISKKIQNFQKIREKNEKKSFFFWVSIFGPTFFEVSSDVLT